MRPVVISVLMALVMAVASTGAAAPKKKKVGAAEPGPTTGSVVITCPVEGATWMVDEGTDYALKGVTPVNEPIPLPPGPHTIRVSKEGYLPFSDVFDVAVGQTTEVEVDLVLYSGRLQVTASPEGVDVEVDGKPLGRAPQSAELAIGEHVVRLSKAGYVEEVRKVTVKTGLTTELNVKLIPVAEAQRRAGGGPIYKKWWFWSVIGAAVAGVVVPSVLLTRPKSESCCKPEWTVTSP